jgi:hypothetical protein
MECGDLDSTRLTSPSSAWQLCQQSGSEESRPMHSCMKRELLHLSIRHLC